MVQGIAGSRSTRLQPQDSHLVVVNDRVTVNNTPRNRSFMSDEMANYHGRTPRNLTEILSILTQTVNNLYNYENHFSRY